MVFKVVKTSEDKKPTKPQIIITNNTQIDQFVNGLELTFDSYFTLYGTVEIEIGSNKILYGNDAEDFKQYRVFSVSTNSAILRRDESIKIYVWNPLTSDVILLGANFDIDDVKRPSTLTGQAIDNQSLLSEIGGGAGDSADTHDIFPYQIYKDETKEFLINTKGRKNMLLTMAASDVTPPAIIPNNFNILPKPTLDFQCVVSPDPRPDITSPTTSSNTRRYIPSDGYKYGYETTYTETYTVSRYHDVFNSIKYGDGTPLTNPKITPWIEDYLLLDLIDSTSSKQIRFDFTNPLFSYTDYIRFAFLLDDVRQYTRTKRILRYYSTSGDAFISTHDSGWLPWRISTQSQSIIYPYVMQEFDVSILVDTSNDVLFNSNVHTLPPITSNGQKTFNTSNRYLRLRRIITPRTPIPYNSSSIVGSGLTRTISYPDPNSMSITNLIDLLSHGGTASLSFWLKGVNNQWIELLKSSQLGAITKGDAELIRHNLTGIPPSQSRFKAVLTIVGSLKTGVSIDLIA